MKLESVIDLEILLIAAADFKIESVTRLDKMLFLLYQTGLFDKCYDEMFEEYGRAPKFGPFTLSLLDDLNAMESLSLIVWSKGVIRMTSAFRVFASFWRITISRVQMATVQMVASLCESMQLERLLEKCYKMPIRNPKVRPEQ